MGNAAAATNSDITSSQIKSINNTLYHTDSSSINTSNNTQLNKKAVSQIKKTKISTGTGCCSVLLHVKKGYDVFSYRRDSVYTANLYLTTTKWYGKDTIKEYKTTNGYFFHTLISKDGWIIGTGGPDIPYLNRQLEDLAGKTTVSGHITSATISSATSILRQLGMGHFLIKAPNDDVGLATYNGGSTKTALFKMTNGQYVSVPNSPACYRTGYVSTINPVGSAINLAVTDRWGVNRRNIMTYQVENVKNIINYNTAVNIYASDSRGTPDNIIFKGQTIGKYTIPRISDKKFIGQVILKNYDTIPQGISGEILKGANLAYYSSFSSDGKNTSVKFNNADTNLHYDVSNLMKSGTWGYGKYTTVIVSGIDEKGRIVQRTVNYYNNLFIQSKLSLSTRGGYVFYNSQSLKKGSQIIEKLSGRISSKLTFSGTINCNLFNLNGQELEKNATGTITYIKEGHSVGTTQTRYNFYYKNYHGNYKIIKIATTSNTAYTKSDTRKSIITSIYQRDSTGKQIGLNITGESCGSEQVGATMANYTGIINIKPIHDTKDIYNENYVTGNYYEKRISTNSILNKTTPLYESLIL